MVKLMFLKCVYLIIMTLNQLIIFYHTHLFNVEKKCSGGKGRVREQMEEKGRLLCLSSKSFNVRKDCFEKKKKQLFHWIFFPIIIPSLYT